MSVSQPRLSHAEIIVEVLDRADNQDNDYVDCIPSSRLNPAYTNSYPKYNRDYTVIIDLGYSQFEQGNMFGLIVVQNEDGSRQVIKFTQEAADYILSASILNQEQIDEYFETVRTKVTGSKDPASDKAQMLEAITVQEQRVRSWLETGEPALNAKEFPYLKTDINDMLEDEGDDWLEEFKTPGRSLADE